MITPGYTLTATERVLPRLALDFTTGSLDSRVTLTRTGATATRVNSSGYIETMAEDTPRFDYDPVTPTICNGLLIEETKQNLKTYSSDYTQATWTKSAGCTIGTNAYVAPTGATTAQAIIPTNNGSTNSISQQDALFQNGRTFSFFAAAGEITSITGQNGAGQTWTFNLSTGVFSGVSDAYSNPTVKQFRDGYWRLSLTCSNMAGTDFFVGAASGANGTNKFYMWGFQLETGTHASSFIPTTSGTQTRNADIVTMTSTNFSSWWQATTGGVLVRANPFSVAGIRPALQFDDATANNIIALRGNTTNPELYIKATTDQAQLDAGTLTANSAYGLAGAWNTNDCGAAINGAAAVTTASATIPTVTQARIGSDGTNYLNGYAQKIYYWPQRITNAETQAFSKV